MTNLGAGVGEQVIACLARNSSMGKEDRTMSQSVNKVILIGFLGEAPEVRFSQQGKPVGTFSVAVNENWKDAQGSRQERVEWFRIVCFGRLAEVWKAPG